MEEQNTPQQDVVLTDNEKQQLESYEGNNSFIKSLSEKFKEYGKLTPRQILAFRNQGKDKVSIEKCTHTGLILNQVCPFKDRDRTIKVCIKTIREKAIKMEEVNTENYAWVPSKALVVEDYFDNSTGEEGQGISLAGWFTRKDDFWKENQPYTPPVKEEPKEVQVQATTSDLNIEDEEDDGMPF